MTRQQQIRFLNILYPAALELEKNENGAPAIFVVAQSALETGWGRSVPRNMYFGVKATKHWKGQKQLIKTTEFFTTPPKFNSMGEPIQIVSRTGTKYVILDWFRAYATPIESLRDHLALMKTKRYRGAFEFKNNPEKFAEFVSNAGYATGKAYTIALHKTMQTVRQLLGIAQPPQESSPILPILLFLAVSTALILR